MQPRSDHALVGPAVVFVALAIILFLGFGHILTHQLDTSTDPEIPTDQITITTHDPNESWIHARLTAQELAPAWHANVTIQLFDPNGTQHRDACLTPELSGAACAQGFGPRQAWQHNAALYIPCQAAGTHHLTVVIHGDIAANEPVTCGGQAR